MPSTINHLMVAELATRFRGMPSAILVDHTKLSAEQAGELRGVIEKQGATVTVVKNSLAVLALRQLELLDVAELVSGPTAVVYGGDDPVILAKTLLEWGRKNKLLEVRGGMLQGRAIDAAGVKALADLPSLHVLQAQLVGAIASPLSGLVGALHGVLRNFVGVVKAIAEKQQAS